MPALKHIGIALVEFVYSLGKGVFVQKTTDWVYEPNHVVAFGFPKRRPEQIRLQFRQFFPHYRDKETSGFYRSTRGDLTTGNVSSPHLVNWLALRNTSNSHSYIRAKVIGLAMKRAVTRYQKPKIQAAILTGLENLERLLLEGLKSGKSKPMTQVRKKWIYRQALHDIATAVRR